eukprot:Clim_evm3s42 gene=Clim_evmTU3s42
MGGGSNAAGVYNMGPGTLNVHVEKLHGTARKSLMDRIKQSGDFDSNGVVLMQGGDSESIYASDTSYPFRQEKFFFYLFGVSESGFYATIDVKDGKTTLFCPRLPEDYVIWDGVIYPPSHFTAKYAVDDCRYVDEMAQFLEQRGPSVLYLNRGQNTDSGSYIPAASFDGIKSFATDETKLYPHLVECRVHKNEEEMKVLRYINAVSSNAHIEMMAKLVPLREQMGKAKPVMEYDLHSVFRQSCIFQAGARLEAYDGIVGSGERAATLHYNQNRNPIHNASFVLCDLGAEYFGYASDITCTYPSNGKFDREHSLVYEAVLDAKNSVEAAAKPGVQWQDMHLLAARVILTHLRDSLKVLTGDVDEMLEKEIDGVFFPHGLGHLMGLDVHDVGGYINGEKRSTRVGLNALRLGRKLEESMCITVEPGCYFIPALLDKALANPDTAKYFNVDELEKFRKIGGVRLEDDLLVTKNGLENLTKVPRTIPEIEAAMRGEYTPNVLPM